MSHNTILTVGGHPDKRLKSKWLYLQQGSVHKTLARFTSDEAAEDFLDILVSVFKGERRTGIEQDDDTIKYAEEYRNEARAALSRAFEVRD